ncbi:MAG TPA: hemerythrin domain-containing protein [Polyangiaceae bacterium]
MSTGAYDVLSEHQHIRRLVDAIEIALDKRTQGGKAWFEELEPVLSELSKGLVAHFKGEEAEFFTDVGKRLPRHAPTIERLVEQHQTLSRDFEEVAQKVSTLNVANAEQVAAFAVLVSKTLKALRTHEEQENELMLVAYWQDLGEAD